MFYFSEKFTIGQTKEFTIPLAERQKEYLLKDVRIKAILDNGDVVENGFAEVSLLLNQDRVLNKITTGLTSGNIASIALNQLVTAITNFEVTITALAGVTIPANVLYIDLSFLVTDYIKK